jgi:hypothetical protein
MKSCASQGSYVFLGYYCVTYVVLSNVSVVIVSFESVVMDEDTHKLI